LDLNSLKLKHSYDLAAIAYATNQYHQDKIIFSQCDLLIEPDLYNYGLFGFKGMKEIFEIGYETASKRLETTAIFDGI
jgi:NTE family protein